MVMTKIQYVAEFKELWNKWEIVGMVLFSLLLQIILIMFGSRRKRITRIWIRILVWSAYLLADMVATVALGIISRSQLELGERGDKYTKAKDSIHAFWAPFLLFHLGGPDTITAFSIEDNELWLRHLLNLVAQVGVAFYVVVKAWNTAPLLTFIAIPVFIAGIVKYGERTWALRSSSTEHITKSLLSVPPRMRLDTNDIMVVPRGHYVPPQTNYLDQAYYLFKMSIYLFEDLILGVTELKDSHSIISCQSSKDGFRLVEFELEFIFDTLYTKAPIVFSKLGIFLRSITLFSSLAALVSFSIFVDKHDFSAADIATTYSLLVGALGLEVYALWKLIFSPRTKFLLTNKFTKPPINLLVKAIYCLHGRFISKERRWSGAIGQYNLISSCLKTTTMIKSLMGFFSIDEMVKYLYVRWEHINDDLKDSIFENLLAKGNSIVEHLDQDSSNLRARLLAQRGDGVLEKMQRLDEFRWCTTAVEFNHSLFIWHIATDLSYYDDKRLTLKLKMSKRLSDYMFYLLVMKPNMLPKGIFIGGTGSRYREAAKEVTRFFQTSKNRSSRKKLVRYNAKRARNKILSMKHAELEDIIAVPIDTTPAIVGAYGSSKYLLVHGCMLAQQLQELETKEKWEIISEVWIEMLTYAASHCEWREHAQQLRSGGELLTHVCLLMAHLGLTEQYRILV